MTEILETVNGKSTFLNFPTKVYKINGGKLWPENSEPISSWRRFKTASTKIDRNLFLEFCDSLLIEVLMPKLSLNLAIPGELESVVIEQSKDLGIGIFPNNQLRPEIFILSLLAIIKKSRSKGEYIGGGYSSSLSDEIPTLEGTDLMIRKDYFDRLCALFKYPPKYYTRKIEGTFA